LRAPRLCPQRRWRSRGVTLRQLLSPRHPGIDMPANVPFDTFANRATEHNRDGIADVSSDLRNAQVFGIAKGTTVHADEAAAWDHRSGSTIKRLTALMVPALEEYFISPACAAPRSASTIISLVPISCGALKSLRGVKTTAGSQTEIR
jgi:hypothetical protein